MASSTAKVEETTFSKENDGVAIVPGEFVDLGFDVGSGDVGSSLEGFSFNLIVEVADVSNNSIIFHLGHIAELNDVLVASSSDENIHLVSNFLETDNFNAFHACLKSTDRIDLSDVNSSTSSFHGFGASFSDVSKATDEDLFA